MIDVQRTPTPPASLAEEDGYRKQDVLDQLFMDFLGKCYLTESPLTRGSFEVDHRYPKGAGGAEHDWTNLYPADPIANLRRPRKWPEGGLLHPDGRDRVEARLTQTLVLEATNLFCRFAAVDAADKPAVNTATELDHLHNSDKTSLKARDLRTAIHHRLTQMLLEERKVLVARRDLPPEDPARREAEQLFQRFVSRSQPFTALLRSQVHPSLRDLLD